MNFPASACFILLVVLQGNYATPILKKSALQVDPPARRPIHSLNKRTIIGDASESEEANDSFIAQENNPFSTPLPTMLIADTEIFHSNTKHPVKKKVKSKRKSISCAAVAAFLEHLLLTHVVDESGIQEGKDFISLELNEHDDSSTYPSFKPFSSTKPPREELKTKSSVHEFNKSTISTTTSRFDEQENQRFDSTRTTKTSSRKKYKTKSDESTIPSTVSFKESEETDFDLNINPPTTLPPHHKLRTKSTVYRPDESTTETISTASLDKSDTDKSDILRTTTKSSHTKFKTKPTAHKYDKLTTELPFITSFGSSKENEFTTPATEPSFGKKSKETSKQLSYISTTEPSILKEETAYRSSMYNTRPMPSFKTTEDDFFPSTSNPLKLSTPKKKYTKFSTTFSKIPSRSTTIDELFLIEDEDLEQPDSDASEGGKDKITKYTSKPSSHTKKHGNKVTTPTTKRYETEEEEDDMLSESTASSEEQSSSRELDSSSLSTDWVPKEDKGKRAKSTPATAIATPQSTSAVKDIYDEKIGTSTAQHIGASEEDGTLSESTPSTEEDTPRELDSNATDQNETPSASSQSSEQIQGEGKDTKIPQTTTFSTLKPIPYTKIYPESTEEEDSVSDLSGSSDQTDSEESEDATLSDRPQPSGTVRGKSTFTTAFATPKSTLFTKYQETEEDKDSLPDISQSSKLLDTQSITPSDKQKSSVKDKGKITSVIPTSKFSTSKVTVVPKYEETEEETDSLSNISKSSEQIDTEEYETKVSSDKPTHSEKDKGKSIKVTLATAFATPKSTIASKYEETENGVHSLSSISTSSEQTDTKEYEAEVSSEKPKHSEKDKDKSTKVTLVTAFATPESTLSSKYKETEEETDSISSTSKSSEQTDTEESETEISSEKRKHSEKDKSQSTKVTLVTAFATPKSTLDPKYKETEEETDSISSTSKSLEQMDTKESETEISSEKPKHSEKDKGKSTKVTLVTAFATPKSTLSPKYKETEKDADSLPSISKSSEQMDTKEYETEVSSEKPKHSGEGKGKSTRVTPATEFATPKTTLSPKDRETEEETDSLSNISISSYQIDTEESEGHASAKPENFEKGKSKSTDITPATVYTTQSILTAKYPEIEDSLSDVSQSPEQLDTEESESVTPSSDKPKPSEKDKGKITSATLPTSEFATPRLTSATKKKHASKLVTSTPKYKETDEETDSLSDISGSSEQPNTEESGSAASSDKPKSSVKGKDKITSAISTSGFATPKSTSATKKKHDGKVVTPNYNETEEEKDSLSNITKSSDEIDTEESESKVSSPTPTLSGKGKEKSTKITLATAFATPESTFTAKYQETEEESDSLASISQSPDQIDTIESDSDLSSDRPKHSEKDKDKATKSTSATAFASPRSTSSIKRKDQFTTSTEKYKEEKEDGDSLSGTSQPSESLDTEESEGGDSSNNQQSLETTKDKSTKVVTPKPTSDRKEIYDDSTTPSTNKLSETEEENDSSPSSGQTDTLSESSSLPEEMLESESISSLENSQEGESTSTKFTFVTTVATFVPSSYSKKEYNNKTTTPLDKNKYTDEKKYSFSLSTDNPLTSVKDKSTKVTPATAFATTKPTSDKKVSILTPQYGETEEEQNLSPESLRLSEELNTEESDGVALSNESLSSERKGKSTKATSAIAYATPTTTSETKEKPAVQTATPSTMHENTEQEIHSVSDNSESSEQIDDEKSENDDLSYEILPSEDEIHKSTLGIATATPKPSFDAKEKHDKTTTNYQETEEDSDVLPDISRSSEQTDDEKSESDALSHEIRPSENEKHKSTLAIATATPKPSSDATKKHDKTTTKYQGTEEDGDVLPDISRSSEQTDDEESESDALSHEIRPSENEKHKSTLATATATPKPSSDATKKHDKTTTKYQETEEDSDVLPDISRSSEQIDVLESDSSESSEKSLPPKIDKIKTTPKHRVSEEEYDSDSSQSIEERESKEPDSGASSDKPLPSRAGEDEGTTAPATAFATSKPTFVTKNKHDGKDKSEKVSPGTASVTQQPTKPVRYTPHYLEDDKIKISQHTPDSDSQKGDISTSLERVTDPQFMHDSHLADDCEYFAKHLGNYPFPQIFSRNHINLPIVLAIAPLPLDQLYIADTSRLTTAPPKKLTCTALQTLLSKILKALTSLRQEIETKN